MKKFKGIIDRFEEDIAVVEINGETRDFDRALFPEDAAAGDIVFYDNHKITLLKEETDKRRKEIEDLMDEVWED